MTKFEIQHAAVGSAFSSHGRVSAPIAYAPVLRPVRAEGEPWWRTLLRWLTGPAVVQANPAVMLPPVAEALPEPVAPRPRAIGASPVHYRAFSLLQPRIVSQDRFSGPDKAIAAFRERAKEIKALTDQQINDAACAVLDTFVELVDAFSPLWDAAGKAEELRIDEVGQGARVELRADILATVAKLDAELARTLAGEIRSREKFDTVQRYVDIRYGEARDDYGLSPL